MAVSHVGAAYGVGWSCLLAVWSRATQQSQLRAHSRVGVQGWGAEHRAVHRTQQGLACCAMLARSTGRMSASAGRQCCSKPAQHGMVLG
jgi:hypothetical protein